MDILEFCQEAHSHCSANPVKHEYTEHRFTSGAYIKAFNAAGFTCTAKAFIDAVIEIGGDPEKGAWTGHPAPELVMKMLLKGRK